MPSPQAIIDTALRGIGRLGSGESSVGGGDADLALTHYNMMIGELQFKGLGWFEVNELFPFAVSQQSYSIGPAGSGANFIMTAGGERPPRFSRAKLVLTASNPDQEIEIPIITVQIYSLIPNPGQSAINPTRVYYQPTYPTGTLWPWPYPTTVTNGLRLYWRNQLSQVATTNITVNIDMPGGVEAALTWDLMRRCAAGGFGVTLTEDQRTIAAASWQVLNTMKNADPVLIRTDLYRGPYQDPIRTPWW